MSSHGGGGGGLSAIHGGILAWAEGLGINLAYILAPFGLLVMLFTLYWIGIPLNRWFGFMFWTSPLWLPYVLFWLVHYWWFEYINLYYDLKQDRVTLEIQFPQEVFKSPLAMETVLTYLWQQASPDNHMETYWDGKRPPRYGLEMVSTGGKVHFYISTPRSKFKDMWETQLYAHYPGIVITELKHCYTGRIPWDPNKYGYFAIRYGLKEPDVIPIKTYIDFGLDKDPKEEFKVDPMVAITEFLGSIGPKEHIWVQLRIFAHRKEEFITGSIHEHADWRGDIKAEIDKILQRDKDGMGKFDTESSPRVSMGEREKAAALERNMGKFAFNCGLRAIYIAELDAFKPGERIGAINSIWRPFESRDRNGLGVKWRTDFNWNWWQDPSGRRREFYKRKELKEYKLRYFNGRENVKSTFILSVEEIASLFHPAGQVVLTPTFERVTSARSEAPANLPRATGV